jgi:uncharacterized protein YjbJ (UPF0337 family)
MDFSVFPGNSGGPVFMAEGARRRPGATESQEVQFVAGMLTQQVELSGERLEIGIVTHAKFIRETVAMLDKIPGAPSPRPRRPSPNRLCPARPGGGGFGRRWARRTRNFLRNSPRRPVSVGSSPTTEQERAMSTNRVEGAIDKAAGAVKEGVGKATDNERLEAEGAAQKAKGDVQNKVGQVQDKIGDAIKK